MNFVIMIVGEFKDNGFQNINDINSHNKIAFSCILHHHAINRFHYFVKL